MPIVLPYNKSIYKSRRDELIAQVKELPQGDNAIILLFAAFEGDAVVFRQERSFYYLAGLEEPAIALAIDVKTNNTILFVPNFNGERAKWVANVIDPAITPADDFAVDSIQYLGKSCKGYQCHPFFNELEYENLLNAIKQWIAEGKQICTLNPNNNSSYVEQRFILARIATIIPKFLDSVVDISSLVHRMRRKKTQDEITLMYNATEIAFAAQDAAAQEIKPGVYEYEVQAAIEYVFTASGASVAFPSIVASGKNSTILHYTNNNKVILPDELVVVDIGAEYNYYCSDITRTYPSSGIFNKRQREVYSLVLDAQEYIADIVKPGMWLSNVEQQDHSINHLAKAYFKKHGMDSYFPHGIGHFLGLNVHDVGDYREPLQEGDVITIEPGIYIPEENLGVRIEDDYWLIPGGAICLSEHLPKSPTAIERVMKEQD